MNIMSSNLAVIYIIFTTFKKKMFGQILYNMKIIKQPGKYFNWNIILSKLILTGVQHNNEVRMLLYNDVGAQYKSCENNNF